MAGYVHKGIKACSTWMQTCESTGPCGPGGLRPESVWLGGRLYGVTVRFVESSGVFAFWLVGIHVRGKLYGMMDQLVDSGLVGWNACSTPLFK